MDCEWVTVNGLSFDGSYIVNGLDWQPNDDNHLNREKAWLQKKIVHFTSHFICHFLFHYLFKRSHRASATAKGLMQCSGQLGVPPRQCSSLKCHLGLAPAQLGATSAVFEPPRCHLGSSAAPAETQVCPPSLL